MSETEERRPPPAPKFVIFHGLRANPGAMTVEYGLQRFTKGEIKKVSDAQFLEAISDRTDEFSAYDDLEAAVRAQNGQAPADAGFDAMPGPADFDRDSSAVAAAALDLMGEDERREFLASYQPTNVDDLLNPPSAVEEFHRAWDKASDDEKLEIAAIVDALTASGPEGDGDGGDSGSGAEGAAATGRDSGDAGGPGDDTPDIDPDLGGEPSPPRRRRKPAGG